MFSTHEHLRPALLAGLFFLATFAAAHQKAPGDGGLLALDLYAQGNTVDLLLATGSADRPSLQHRRSEDGGLSWSPAVEVPTTGSGLHSPHRGADPQLAASGPRLIALWTRPGTSRWGSGALATAISSDGGRSWAPGPNPADDGSTDGHGFTDLAVDASGVFHAVWLDGRDGGQGLRTARSHDGGLSWLPNLTVDHRTCECCSNQLLAAGGKLWVIYRDRDPRDLAVAASQDGGASWSRLATAGTFNWQIEACPHNGGALAAIGESRLTALAFTGAEGQVGLYTLTSPDGGKSWATPVRLQDERAQRGDLAALRNTLLAVWDSAGANGRVIRASVSMDGGGRWSEATQLSSPGAEAAQPRVVALGRGFLVAWSETRPRPQGQAGDKLPATLGLVRVEVGEGGQLRHFAAPF